MFLIRIQNRITSEQSAIVKSFSKLPKYFELGIYPTLVIIVTDNEAAKAVVGRDFDVTVSCVLEFALILNEHDFLFLIAFRGIQTVKVGKAAQVDLSTATSGQAQIKLYYTTPLINNQH